MLFARAVARVAVRRFSPLARGFGQPHWSTHPHLLAEGEVYPGFLAEEFASRRRAVLACMPDESVLIAPSAMTQYISHDIPYPFRQDTDYFWLTGCMEDSTCLVLVRERNGDGRSILFMKERDPSHETWWGPTTGFRRSVEFFKVDEGRDISELAVFLRRLGVAPATAAPGWTFYRTRHPQQDQFRSLLQFSAAENGGLSHVRDAAVLLHPLRSIKSPAELATMRKSAAMAASGFRRVAQLLGQSRQAAAERELAVEFEYEVKRLGAQRLAYPCVVGAGENATFLHYIRNECLLPTGKMVLMDAGCEYNMYASDITRTYPIGGGFGVVSPTYASVYAYMLSVQEQLVDACRTGTSFDEIHAASVHAVVDLLMQIGVLRQSRDEIYGRGLYMPFYPHSIGHLLGIDVHDCEGFRFAGDKLRPGMVVTIEPGIYFPEHINGLPQELRGLGIRIEDDILVNAGSAPPEVLTAAAPKTINDIQEAMAMPLDRKSLTDCESGR